MNNKDNHFLIHIQTIFSYFPKNPLFIECTLIDFLSFFSYIIKYNNKTL
jgi:hypothetical protein